MIVYDIEEVPVVKYESVCLDCGWRSPAQEDEAKAQRLAIQHAEDEHYPPSVAWPVTAFADSAEEYRRLMASAEPAGECGP